jgi:hypothetical protein
MGRCLGHSYIAISSILIGTQNEMVVGLPTNGDSLGEAVISELSNFHLREKE